MFKQKLFSLDFLLQAAELLQLQSKLAEFY